MKCKKFLFNVLNETLLPLRKRREWYERDKAELLNILKKGTEKAVEVTERTLTEVREAIGINYFNTNL